MLAKTKAGVVIGFLFPVDSALDRIVASRKNVAQRFPRWGCCTLDGVRVGENSRTKSEAVRFLRRYIERRVINS